MERLFIKEDHYHKVFVRNLNLSSVQEEIQSKKDLMKQLTQPVQKSQKPKQTPPYSKKRRRNKK